MQFYDHFIDWGLKEEIINLTKIRTRNRVHETSNVNIMASDPDLYVAMIDQKVIVKIGTKFDTAQLVPSNYKIVTYGKDYCVWEKQA